MKETCEQIPFHFFLKFMMLRLGPGYEIRQGNSEGLGEMAEKSGNYTELHFL